MWVEGAPSPLEMVGRDQMHADNMKRNEKKGKRPPTATQEKRKLNSVRVYIIIDHKL